MGEEIIQVGDIREGVQIMAVHIQEGHTGEKPDGVVLGYRLAKREYAVCNIGAHGGLYGESRRYDINDALNIYAERLMKTLYSHHNRIAPTYTYERPNAG